MIHTVDLWSTPSGLYLNGWASKLSIDDLGKQNRISGYIWYIANWRIWFLVSSMKWHLTEAKPFAETERNLELVYIIYFNDRMYNCMYMYLHLFCKPIQEFFYYNLTKPMSSLKSLMLTVMLCLSLHCNILAPLFNLSCSISSQNPKEKNPFLIKVI